MLFPHRTHAELRALSRAVWIGAGVGLIVTMVGLVSAPADGGETAHARRLTAALLAGYRADPHAGAPAGPAIAPPAPSEPVATLGPRGIAQADIECLAAAVYYEARGEAPEGQAAVAQVVLNRARRPEFPKSVCAVVYQGGGRAGCQFSFACDGAMKRPRDPDAWALAHQVAVRALAGYVMPAIGQATAFQVAGGRRQRGVRLGAHLFYVVLPRARTPAGLREADNTQARVATLTAAADTSEPQPRAVAER